MKKFKTIDGIKYEEVPEPKCHLKNGKGYCGITIDASKFQKSKSVLYSFSTGKLYKEV